MPVRWIADPSSQREDSGLALGCLICLAAMALTAYGLVRLAIWLWP